MLYNFEFFGALTFLFLPKDVNPSELPLSSTIIVARLANIALDSLITDQLKYHSLAVQVTLVLGDYDICM